MHQGWRLRDQPGATPEAPLLGGLRRCATLRRYRRRPYFLPPFCGLSDGPSQYEPALAHQRPCRALVNQCAFTRLHNSYRDVDRKQLDIAHPRRKLRRLSDAPGNPEVRTVDQQFAGITHLRVEVIVVRARIDNVRCFVEMKLPWA